MSGGVPKIGKSLPDDVVAIPAFLRNEGFDSPEAFARARAVLEEEGLTRPGKQGMAATKLARAREILNAKFVRVCGNDDCVQMAQETAPDREPLVVMDTSCAYCGGSNNRRAARQAVRLMRARGIERLLVVGGTPTQHAELLQLLGDGDIKMRFVDGAEGRHTKREAINDLEWAHLVVIWGATPLPHKVSNLYTEDPAVHVRTIKLARRGIESLCTEIIRSLSPPDR